MKQHDGVVSLAEFRERREKRRRRTARKPADFEVAEDGSIRFDFTTDEGMELEWHLTPEQARTWGRRFLDAAAKGYARGGAKR
jgi:hypothetical protein